MDANLCVFDMNGMKPPQNSERIKLQVLSLFMGFDLILVLKHVHACTVQPRRELSLSLSQTHTHIHMQACARAQTRTDALVN